MTETGKKKTRNVWWARRSTWGVVAAVTILPSLALGMTVGSAQAQAGSRICGAYWEGKNAIGGKIIYAQAEEVPKTDHAVCDTVRRRADNYRGPDRLKVGESRAMNMWTCEKFGELLLNRHGADPCLNMKRRDHDFAGHNMLKFFVQV
jgi:hypothetical protein